MKRFRISATIVAMSLMGMFFMTSCNEPKPEPEPDPKPDTGEEVVEYGDFKVSIDNLKYDEVTITITPPEWDPVYYACLYSDTSISLSPDDAVMTDYIFTQTDYNDYIMSGKQTFTIKGLTAHSHYRMLFFSYYEPTEEMTSPLYRTERISTPDGPQVFDITVDNVSSLAAEISIEPHDPQMTYYYYVYTKEKYLTSFEDNDYELVMNDIAYWDFNAGENYTWQELMNMELVRGKQVCHTDDLYNLLKWDTEYMVYAYGMDTEGYMTSQVNRAYFKTNPRSENVDMTFECEVSKCEWNNEYQRYECEIDVTPSTDQHKYFVTMTNADWWDWYFTDQCDEPNDEDTLMYTIMRNARVGSRELLSLCGFEGKYTYKPAESRLQYFTPSKEHVILVFGIDENGPITPISVFRYTTPASPYMEGE